MLDFKKFKILIALALRRVKMHHRAKFCANRLRRCGDMAVFDFLRWQLSAILDFKKLLPIPFRRPKCITMPNFVQIGQTVVELLAIFNFSRWRLSAILDLLYACLDHPRSVFWWSLSLCKIWFESVQ